MPPDDRRACPTERGRKPSGDAAGPGDGAGGAEGPRAEEPGPAGQLLYRVFARPGPGHELARARATDAESERPGPRTPGSRRQGRYRNVTALNLLPTRPSEAGTLYSEQ